MGLGGRSFPRTGKGLAVPDPRPPMGTLPTPKPREHSPPCLWGARFLPRDWLCCRRLPPEPPRTPAQAVRPRVPVSPPQPAPGASPMKRSVSTLAPQRPRAAPLCNAAPDRAPAGQAAAHHHHRCHRRRDRKQKSLEKGPSLSADTDGGA